MWSVVLLFLGLMKAASYVAGSGTTVDEKSGMSVLRVRPLIRPVNTNVKLQLRSNRTGIYAFQCIPVNRKYLEMPVAFREKTQFAISYVAYIAAGRVRTDKEEKIKVFVDASCSTSSKCKHGQAGRADRKSGHAGTSEVVDK
ncbi:Uncharacterized protein DBV15_01940 [Temnothorax longispinosus]|uniref:Secreted protein n=1 Tax=Temnothorax longispinosus TaxID=300112 RepID=A0A4S2KX93_9HYME|nr:Uncharacterized protein DBV15_01940 [Temnothorax longispinosus]